MGGHDLHAPSERDDAQQVLAHLASAGVDKRAHEQWPFGLRLNTVERPLVAL